MPNLNVNETGGFEELPTPTRMRRPQRKGGGGVSPVVLIFALLALAGVAAYLLNEAGIVHLWGEKKPERVAGQFPPPLPGEEVPAADTEVTPPPEITALSGPFVFQVSSWQSMGKAQQEVNKLKIAGLNAFLEEFTTGGITWHRVRVGYYATAREARQAAEQYEFNWEGGYFVARIR